MAASVSDFPFERLGDRGIRRIYGYPGDGINGASARMAQAEAAHRPAAAASAG